MKLAFVLLPCFWVLTSHGQPIGNNVDKWIVQSLGPFGIVPIPIPFGSAQPPDPSSLQGLSPPQIVYGVSDTNNFHSPSGASIIKDNSGSKWIAIPLPISGPGLKSNNLPGEPNAASPASLSTKIEAKPDKVSVFNQNSAGTGNAVNSVGVKVAVGNKSTVNGKTETKSGGNGVSVGFNNPLSGTAVQVTKPDGIKVPGIGIPRITGGGKGTTKSDGTSVKSKGSNGTGFVTRTGIKSDGKTATGSNELNIDGIKVKGINPGGIKVTGTTKQDKIKVNNGTKTKNRTGVTNDMGPKAKIGVTTSNKPDGTRVTDTNSKGGIGALNTKAAGGVVPDIKKIIHPAGKIVKDVNSAVGKTVNNSVDGM